MKIIIVNSINYSISVLVYQNVTKCYGAINFIYQLYCTTHKDKLIYFILIYALAASSRGLFALTDLDPYFCKIF